MGLSYYTLVSKTVQCPMWGDAIKVTAKYRYVEKSENPYLARFAYATCEVIENSKLPEWKRDKRLGLYTFCKIKDCPCLKDFPAQIDVRGNRPI